MPLRHGPMRAHHKALRPCRHGTSRENLAGRQVCLLLENRGSTGIDMSVSIRHRGSDWSKEWEFELPVKDEPFSFSERFDPPAAAERRI